DAEGQNINIGIGNGKEAVCNMFDTSPGDIEMRARSNNQAGHQTDKQGQNAQENRRSPKSAARNAATDGKESSEDTLARLFFGDGILLVAMNIVKFGLGKPLLSGGDFIKPEPKKQ